jgi:hypothetical protein
MTSSEPPPEPQPGPEGQRRFSGPSVALGVVAGLVGTPLLLVLAVVVLNGVSRAFGDVPAPALLVLLVFAGPLLAAILLASRHAGSRRRGFALGLAIGWGAFLILGAGVCVAIVQQLGST